MDSTCAWFVDKKNRGRTIVFTSATRKARLVNPAVNFRKIVDRLTERLALRVVVSPQRELQVCVGGEPIGHESPPPSQR
jgi:hypothetical protein